MQQCSGERAERDRAEQHEGERRRQEAVQRIGRINRGEGDRGPGGGEDRRNVRRRDGSDRRQVFLAPRDFAGGQQRQREQAAEQHAHFGAEQAGFDGIFDEAAERQRQAADPHHPAGAEPFFEAGRRRGNRRRGIFRRSVGGLFDIGGGIDRERRRDRLCSFWRDGRRRLRSRKRGRRDALGTFKLRQPRGQFLRAHVGLAGKAHGNERDHKRDEFH